MQFKIALVILLTGLVLIPDATSEYTVRRLSENGVDSPECLYNPTQPCQTLAYALSPTDNDMNTTSDLQLLVLPGVYGFGRKNLALFNSTNLIIQKMPESSTDRRVVFRCEFPSNDYQKYNSIAFFFGQNITLVGITIVECGTEPVGLYIEECDDVLISNCIFQ